MKKIIPKYISSNKKLGERMKRIRLLYNYSQREIALYLDMDRSTYAYYEASKTTPNLFTLFKLCYIYNIDIRYFLLEDNKKSQKYLK